MWAARWQEQRLIDTVRVLHVARAVWRGHPQFFGGNGNGNRAGCPLFPPASAATDIAHVSPFPSLAALRSLPRCHKTRRHTRHVGDRNFFQGAGSNSSGQSSRSVIESPNCYVFNMDLLC